jgi:phosphate transport system permease protein
MKASDSETHGSGSDVAERIRLSATSDRPYHYLLRGTALFFGAVIILFVWSVVHTAWPAVHQFGLGLVTGKTWVPGTGLYGALPLLIAVPVGLASSLALLYIVPRRLRTTGAALVELLAAVPSVVYGLWGLFYLIPWLTKTLQPFLAGITGSRWPFNGPQEGFSVLLAGIVLSIMILPTIVAISRDVISVVPADLVEGGLSLGATRSQVFTRVVMPSARTGILGAIALGAGRALGETIAVAMVIGSNPQIPHSLFSSGATLASTIATEFGEATGSTGSALAALALMLMIITAAVNAGARLLTKRALVQR